VADPLYNEKVEIITYRETYRERDNAKESEAGRIIVWETNNIVLVTKEMEMPHELTLNLV
jgi:hypothetical protein